jgi:N-acetylneuraminate epimerase
VPITIHNMAVAALLTCSTAAYADWEQLAPIPDKSGVAAPFAGVSGDTLLVAGGANFPDKAPWDGGKKVWYDTIYALSQAHAQWKPAGKLLRAIGYGVSVNSHDRIVCVGGNDADRCYADAFWLDYKNGKVTTSPLPSLPTPIANACGACVGDMLYIAGGQVSPTSTQAERSVFRIDLTSPKATWQTLDPIPGSARILATAASFDGSFYVIGGTALSEAPDHSVKRQYLADAYRYTDGTGWLRLADLPVPIVAAPSPAPTDDTGIFILGGDDGSHVGFKPANLHPGFSKTILHFDQRAGTWAKAGEMPAARVTAPCVHWNNQWVITSGEMRPGVRSPQVWMFNTKESR